MYSQAQLNIAVHSTYSPTICARQRAITTADASFVTEINRVAKPCPPAHVCLKSEGRGYDAKSHGSGNSSASQGDLFLSIVDSEWTELANSHRSPSIFTVLLGSARNWVS
jgi:hypothetical protein